MKLELIAFSRRGNALAEKLAEKLTQNGHQAACTREGLSAERWAARAFGRAEGLIFVGAAGIAVRSIAPHLRHKSNDPAVVAVDEAGRFAVPLLSGHIGGANDLAREIAALTGGEAAVTTATDVNGVFAADQWARRQGLLVRNPETIVRVSAKLLAGEPVRFWSRWSVSGPQPAGLEPSDRDCAELLVDWLAPGHDALWLCPRGAVRAGIGCKRGSEAAAIRTLFQAVLEEETIPAEAVGTVCSIDLKAEEPGLLAFCGERGLPLVTYSARELAAVSGEFSASPFVKKTIGVDNVCERAALAEGGVLLRSKTVKDGVTLALAGRAPELNWGDTDG